MMAQTQAEVDLKTFAEQITTNIERVIVGKREAVRLVVVGLLAEGHMLIEDAPGVGKTMLARSLARSLDCSFSRVQFTPDMLPSDLTGVYIFNQRSREFEFRPGPLLAQVVLADEINRATPKTQSALLEAMGERQITVDGVSHKLPNPFVVLATQNPIEYEGTFRLPEAQLDRFLMRVRLGYAELEQEIEILDRQQFEHPLDTLGAVATADDLFAAQTALKEIFVSPAVKRYIVELVRAVRNHPHVFVGPSARASLGLYRTGQARAGLQGRDHVLPDDIKELAEPVIAHRFLLLPETRLRDLTPSDILAETLKQIPIPA
jgi:MoxR-like ATPase